jgi:hypothetical protein
LWIDLTRQTSGFLLCRIVAEANRETISAPGWFGFYVGMDTFSGNEPTDRNIHRAFHPTTMHLLLTDIQVVDGWTDEWFADYMASYYGVSKAKERKERERANHIMLNLHGLKDLPINPCCNTRRARATSDYLEQTQ